MVETKEGKIDIDYFKNMIQNGEVTEMEIAPSGFEEQEVKYDYISGWFLNFFAYFHRRNIFLRNKEDKIKVKDFQHLANQMLIIPFIIDDSVLNKTYDMKYKVGFVGCDINENKQVFPIQGWIVSPNTKNDEDGIL